MVNKCVAQTTDLALPTIGCTWGSVRGRSNKGGVLGSRPGLPNALYDASVPLE